jgi:ABC-2 type transport system ATP-binding protein
VKDLGTSHTVLLSTHILSEVEAVCSRVLVIAKGKLVAEGATRDLAKMRRTSAALVTVRGRAEDARKVLKAVKGMGAVKALPEPGAAAKDDEKTCSFRFTGRAKDEVDGLMLVEQAVAALVQAGLAVREVRAAEGSLEDLFAELTGDPKSADDADDAGADA